MAMHLRSRTIRQTRRSAPLHPSIAVARNASAPKATATQLSSATARNDNTRDNPIEISDDEDDKPSGLQQLKRGSAALAIVEGRRLQPKRGTKRGRPAEPDEPHEEGQYDGSQDNGSQDIGRQDDGSQDDSDSAPPPVKKTKSVVLNHRSRSHNSAAARERAANREAERRHRHLVDRIYRDLERSGRGLSHAYGILRQGPPHDAVGNVLNQPEPGLRNLDALPAGRNSRRGAALRNVLLQAPPSIIESAPVPGTIAPTRQGSRQAPISYTAPGSPPPRSYTPLGSPALRPYTLPDSPPPSSPAFTTLNTAGNQDERLEEDCSICFWPLRSKTRVVVTVCNHMFCKACFMDWRGISTDCAMCRQPL